MTADHAPPAGHDAPGALRCVLLALVVLTTLGLIAELLLLEHFESWQQWMPLALLGLVLVSCIAVVLRPGRRALRVFRVLMALCVLVGLLGVYLHYSGNVEFELERDPGLGALPLFWESIRGATPTLAAGALSQLGLLGLVYAFRHPMLKSPSTRRSGHAPGLAADTHHQE
ncbi:MAG TPA: hypothetical protein VGE02_11230 [Gemmatimonadales bacterium]